MPRRRGFSPRLPHRRRHRTQRYRGVHPRRDAQRTLQMTNTTGVNCETATRGRPGDDSRIRPLPKRSTGLRYRPRKIPSLARRRAKTALLRARWRGSRTASGLRCGQQLAIPTICRVGIGMTWPYGQVMRNCSVGAVPSVLPACRFAGAGMEFLSIHAVQLWGKSKFDLLPGTWISHCEKILGLNSQASGQQISRLPAEVFIAATGEIRITAFRATRRHRLSHTGIG